ncbi:hypothetical protein ACFLWA_03800 [Chloroflexota bacterium]
MPFSQPDLATAYYLGKGGNEAKAAAKSRPSKVLRVLMALGMDEAQVRAEYSLPQWADPNDDR